MHRYLHYLLSDIQAAHKAEMDEELTFPKSFEEEMEEVERYIRGDDEQPLSYYTKLYKEVFPPAERLSQNEIKILLEAFITMLKTWNAQVDFPVKMPLKERYEFLRNNILEVGITPINSGQIHFDFCSGDASDCDWGKYCSCIEYRENEEL